MSKPDFSKLNSKHRQLLSLLLVNRSVVQIAELLREKHLTVQRRKQYIVHILGVKTIQEAISAWKNHPNKDNSVLWDVVDALREEMVHASRLRR